ncbi:hypothetical protein SGFS_006530 [Streptomyces graminofaciens]|uniref:Uncharacterized protein n=1 Tax=Streptomyces graminofaciens TaxID=68212 RepID=A0ABN5V803_9ACTN|nr:hypothetical protein SGFS_006530 [Streptomyces graminofaciens]
MHAELDTNPYPTGIQISDDEIAALPITRHRFHGDWNCTPQPPASAGRDGDQQRPRPGPGEQTALPQAGVRCRTLNGNSKPPQPPGRRSTGGVARGAIAVRTVIGLRDRLSH